MIRSHALIADLLTTDQMFELAESGSVEDFISRLSGTPYGKISIDETGDPSLAFEKAFYLKFIERMIKIVEITPKKIGEFLQAYYYLRFEVLNLKRILRGKFSGLPVPQILDYLIPMEPYQVSDYTEIAEAGSLEKSVELLRGTPYSTIEASLELCTRYDALWPIEQALNHFYAETVLRALGSLSRRDRTLVNNILKFEVDVGNLLNAIKYRRTREVDREPLELEELFPLTFDIDLNQIRALIEAEELRMAINGLGEPFSEILSPIYTGDVALIRTRVRSETYKIVQRGRAMNDFGFNVIMAYLLFSELEKDDLVGVAWGLTQGIPSEELTKYLTII